MASSRTDNTSLLKFQIMSQEGSSNDLETGENTDATETEEDKLDMDKLEKEGWEVVKEVEEFEEVKEVDVKEEGDEQGK